MTKEHTQLRRAPDEPEQEWSPVTNPAVREILDHLAEELAREYVRLMERVANAEVDNSEVHRQEG